MIEFHVDNDGKNIFPLTKSCATKKDKNEEIHSIMKYCYINGVPPGTNNIAPKDLKFDIEEQHKDKNVRFELLVAVDSLSGCDSIRTRYISLW